MTSHKTIFISAGETSGDMHASGLIRELKKYIPSVKIAGLGGEELRNEGTELLYHSSDLAAMGFWEVIKKLGFFIGVNSKCRKYLRKNKPDLIILVDYPGMNLKIAKAGYELGIPVVYFILPQVWAWKSKRTLTLSRFCKKLISILPFEVEFFKRFNIDIDYVGHPLIDIISEANDISQLRSELEYEKYSQLIALLPGSREQEIIKNLPVMLGTLSELEHKFKKLQGILIKAPDRNERFYYKILNESASKIKLVDNDKYNHIKAADVALVASGTATLETALCGTPGVVIYKTSPLTYEIARRMIKIDTIALANLVAEKKIFPEFIQDNAIPSKIANEAEKLLRDKVMVDKLKKQLIDIKNKLHPYGAYKNAAKIIYEEFLK